MAHTFTSADAGLPERAPRTHGMSFVVAVGAIAWLAAIWVLQTEFVPSRWLIFSLVLVSSIACVRLSALAASHMALVLVLLGVALVVNEAGTYYDESLRLVLIWSLSFLGGSLVTSWWAARSSWPVSGLAVPVLSKTHVGVALAFVAVELGLGVSGRLGYEAQVTVGTSTPVGFLGTVASLTGPWVLLVLLIAIRQRQLVGAALLAVGLHAIALVLQGFRGGIIYFAFLTVVLVWIVTVDDQSVRAKWLRVAALPIAVFSALAGFWATAIVKRDSADRHGVSSAGTELWSSDWLQSLLLRIDLMYAVDVSVSSQDSPLAQEAVDWANFAFVWIPRFLYPDKPVVDYGQGITEMIYGKDYLSSSTVSWLGDTLINTGEGGVMLFAGLFGAMLVAAERVLPRYRSPFAWAALVSVATASVRLESSLPLMAAQVVRTVVILGCTWWVATRLARLFRSNVQNPRGP